MFNTTINKKCLETNCVKNISIKKSKNICTILVLNNCVNNISVKNIVLKTFNIKKRRTPNQSE